MMETQVIKQYIYQQYQDDLDLQAFVDSFNGIAQGYVDWANSIGIPIYTNLFGALLDWIGVSLYGLPRPIVGALSGAIYGAFFYDQATYGSGNVNVTQATDDVYKRVLTWKLHRGDGRYTNIQWLKRRIKRFIIGTNGTSPDIDHTHEISVQFGPNNAITVVINYPQDPASVTLACQYINLGVLDVPFQYSIFARSA
jgi:hypothetical protein